MQTAIYFPEDTYRLIARCGLTASEMSIDFYAAAVKDPAPGTRAHLMRVENARTALSQRYGAEYGPAREAVIKIFRKIFDPTT